MSDIMSLLSENTTYKNRSDEVKKITKWWEKTGLLEGLSDSNSQQIKSNIAVLLENQKGNLRKEFLLRESSAMASGDVTGFAAVAFPLVRRVFANIVANELISVQPMSLPTGLIFYLDFQAGSNKSVGLTQNASVFGGGAVGSEIAPGISLAGVNADTGFYNLNVGYGSPTGSATAVPMALVMSGTVGSNSAYSQELDKLVKFDPDLSGAFVYVGTIPLSAFTTNGNALNERAYTSVTDVSTGVSTPSGSLVRRLTSRPTGSSGLPDSASLLVVYSSSLAPSTLNELAFMGSITASYASHDFKFAIDDDFVAGSALGSTVGDPAWGLEYGGNVGENAEIPQIDIKIDATDITAITKKLKARWTPELGQDLNSYHNLDAEVELTSMLSELISLEIDVEILGDLVKHASAGTYYWSRRPGRFLNRTTGQVLAAAVTGDFTGNVSEWYQTLLEAVNDVSAQIQRKVLRGGATFLVTSPEVANILEFTQTFIATVTHDQDSAGSAGVGKVGTLSKKWDVYVTSYFHRNLILIGRKGSSALETGYVYAPYVPLQTTPVIPDPDTFVLNKGVMTRYGKKIVRADMYGLVVVQDLFG